MAQRTQKSAYNLAMNIGSQILAVLLSFVSRTVFIYTLDARYLGINGLFTNIISLLSLTELGVSTALIFSMYKPLAHNDHRKLAALTGFYKKLYTVIGAVIAALGLGLFPFLDFFINLDESVPNVRYYYLLFLLQSVCSYFMVYKTSIMTADQKGYILTRNQMAINTIATLMQIAVLLLWKNYVIYLLVVVFFNIFGNYYNSRVAEKQYPYINDPEELELEEKKYIWSNIQSMFLYKVGGVVLNNTDNILISKLVGTLEVGFYSNYSLILNKVGNITSLVFTSIQASLGSLNVEADARQKKFIFNTLSLISFWVYGFCSICFCLLLQDFITIWVGERYLLSRGCMYICVANYYLQGVLYPIWCFRNTTGLFRETKYTMVVASVLNIGLSIVWGIEWGMSGIFLATIVSRLCTNVWYDPYRLFKSYFGTSVCLYYFTEIGRILFLIGFIAASEFLFAKIAMPVGWPYLLIKAFYCVVVVNMLFFLHYRKDEHFRFLIEKALTMVRNMMKKGGNRI